MDNRITYLVVKEPTDDCFVLALARVDHLVLGIYPVSVVVKGHLASHAPDVACLQVLKNHLARVPEHTRVLAILW